MIDGAKEIVSSLNSPSDWAVVGTAASLGFILDGAINIVPIPFFSPGMCALAAAGLSLSFKRGVEDYIGRARGRTRYHLLMNEFDRCMADLIAQGKDAQASSYLWECKLAAHDVAAIETIVRSMRTDASPIETSLASRLLRANPST